jgi:glucosamine-phosphate N-acetyltransferase
MRVCIGSSNIRGRIIDQLKSMGNELGVYKIILDCNDKNIDFYEKCGFQKKENCMAWYIPGR